MTVPPKVRLPHKVRSRRYRFGPGAFRPHETVVVVQLNGSKSAWQMDVELGEPLSSSEASRVLRFHMEMMAGDPGLAGDALTQPIGRGRPPLTSHDHLRCADAWHEPSERFAYKKRETIADEFGINSRTAEHRRRLAAERGLLAPRPPVRSGRMLPNACRCGDAYSEHDGDGCERCRCGEYVAARDAGQFDFSRR